MKVDSIRHNTLSYNVRTKIRDNERERIFESGELDSEATGRLAESKTSRLRRTAFKGFFPTLREQMVEEKENPYALRDDLVKPLQSEGHLVKTTIFNAPKQAFNNFTYNLSALKKGINGTANDHELGKLNSIGLVTGGAALATYLATRRQVSTSKAMEFVGLGSFLASMALWPVIAIQIPTKLIHGFNVRQKYVDSSGREKPFYNDPLYRPWDLYDEKEIYRIGDYMGVPQDMNNRRDYIQKKMSKVATQDNTLWMVSAGFAVPIMSALMCNQLEGPVQKLCAYFRSEQNKKNLQKALGSSCDIEGNDMYKRLDSFLALNNGKPLQAETINQLCEILTIDSNPELAQKFTEELRAKLTSKTSIIEPQDTEKMLKSIRKNLEKKFGKNSPIVETLMLNQEELTKILTDNELVNKDLGKGDFKKLNKLIIDNIFKKADAYNSSGIVLTEQIDKVKILQALNNTVTARNAVDKFRLTKPSLMLDVNMQNLMRNLAKEIITVQHKSGLIKEFLFNELSASPETKLANVANEMTESIFKALKISAKPLDKARGDRALMGPVVRSTIDRIASSKTEYEQVMAKLAEIAKKVDECAITSNSGKPSEFDKTIASVLDSAATRFTNLGFADTAQMLAGEGANSEKSILKGFANNRLLSVKSTIYRLITALDMHRRIVTGQNIGAIRGSGLCREVKEEIVELSKRTTLTAHRSDFATKFFFNGNPHPDYSDVSDIEIKNGKVFNKYFGATREGLRDVSADPSLYRGTMQLMYDDAILPDTKKILGDKLARNLENYRAQCLSAFGDEWYFIKPNSNLFNNVNNYEIPKTNQVPNKFKFLLTGLSLDDMAMKYASQKHNAKVWMKMFGGLGLGVLGATVLAQFFFGKTPQPKEQTQV